MKRPRVRSTRRAFIISREYGDNTDPDGRREVPPDGEQAARRRRRPPVGQLDGLRFYEAVEEERPDLPFILFTGEGSADVAVDAVEVGVTDYVRKRVGSAQYTLLANRVRSAVDRTLIDNFPSGGVFTFDEDLTYTLAGGEELEAVGLTAEDIVGSTPSELFPEGVAAELETNFRVALDGEHRSFERTYQGNHYQVHTLPVGEESVTTGMAVSDSCSRTSFATPWGTAPRALLCRLSPCRTCRWPRRGRCRSPRGPPVVPRVRRRRSHL